MQQAESIVVFFTQSAEPVARSAAEALGLSIHGRGACGPVDAEFDDVAAYLRTLFLAGHGIVGVCASGILIRALAPVLNDKWREPPVIALAEDGSSAIPLLGGHRGANRLAMKLATHFSGHAAITTAGELSLGVALDEPPDGWRLENPNDVKAATAALLSGATAKLSGEAEWLAPLREKGRISAQSDLAGPASPIVLTVENCEPLLYRRQSLIVGVGCSRGCPPDELIALVQKTLAEHGRSIFEVRQVVSIDLKSDEAAIHALAAHLGIKAQFFNAETLAAQKDRLANPSDIVFAEVGCHGVAEGATLTAAGPGAVLAIEKTKSAHATCAAAEYVDGTLSGKKRGRLSIIGIGPGQSDWRTPEASRLIADAEDIVGYSLYIDLLGGAATGKARHDFPLGAEEERCRFALEKAGEGRNVALVCSGDAGIYAMGALVQELLHHAADAGLSQAAQRAEIVNAPGITAMQAASARAGALLGHDFCAISLSDLLTLRDDIIRRLKSAAEGDFVVALYNPVSRRRRTLLPEAREILLQYRSADTPVLLASNLGRPDERLMTRTLQTLSVDEVDMLTVILIGSSASRAFRSGDISAGAEGCFIYTPRGYPIKNIERERT